MLSKFRDDVWTCGTGLKMMGVELGTRMTIVKLDAQGSLFVHSPIKLSVELKGEIDSIGTVKYVVAPNKWHHLFVGDFKAAYPNAQYFCAPGLDRKRSDFKFDRVIDSEAGFPWNPVLEHKLIKGTPIFNEVVFFHHATRTLIVTDLAIHVCESDSWYTRLILRALGSYGHFGWSKVEKVLYVRDRAAFQKSVDEVLKWDIEGILLTHGELVSLGGREKLRASFS